MLTPEQITPMPGLVLIKLDPKQEMSSIIHTPEHLKKHAEYGEVLRIGPPKRNHKNVPIHSVLTAGDRVLLGPNKGTWVNDTPGFKNSGPVRDDGTGNDRLVLAEEYEIEGVVI